jgi:hypothetical protein
LLDDLILVFQQPAEDGTNHLPPSTMVDGIPFHPQILRIITPRSSASFRISFSTASAEQGVWQREQITIQIVAAWWEYFRAPKKGFNCEGLQKPNL